MSYCIYILKSLSCDHYYIGQTDNLEKRLRLHNVGKVKSSSRYKPWKLHHTEVFKKKTDAIKREKYLKSHAGRNWLKKYLGP